MDYVDQSDSHSSEAFEPTYNSKLCSDTFKNSKHFYKLGIPKFTNIRTLL